jgi:hypothetical protein
MAFGSGSELPMMLLLLMLGGQLQLWIGTFPPQASASA